MDPMITAVNALVSLGPPTVYLVGLVIVWQTFRRDVDAARARERELHEELIQVVERYHEGNQELATTLSIIAERLDDDIKK